MPTLHWIGKEKVINHHLDVPFKVLDHTYGFSADKGKTTEPTGSGNKIIHGDNLEALKALLPEYEGRIKCIYIDPPYNTGNENWVYNDNVNDPKIKKWLHSVVGKEGEDLSRHDKWLCMMYPRLVLLSHLLHEDGIIFISLDDNEAAFLKLVLDEIFGGRNFIQQIIWKNKYGPGAMTKGFGNVHEYIFCYSKKTITSIESYLSEEEIKKYKQKDKNFSIRGGYVTQPLATKSKDDRPNLVYPITYNGVEIMPDKQWIWSKERVEEAMQKDWLQITETNGAYSVRFKQYLRDEYGTIRKSKPISILNGPFNQEGTEEITSIFKRKVFNNPKPTSLIEYLISMIINGSEDKEGVYLDSFAGSGSTAHAVLNLNKQDGGNRKFILIETEEYAENITAERVMRVISGYGDKGGTGGSFDFYELGQPLFNEDNTLNETVHIEKIRNYIFYTETQTNLQASNRKDNRYFLDLLNETAYYFYYEPGNITTLNHEFLNTLQTEALQYIIYADNCVLTKEFMTKNHIIFRKIPRDIALF